MFWLFTISVGSCDECEPQDASRGLMTDTKPALARCGSLAPTQMEETRSITDVACAGACSPSLHGEAFSSELLLANFAACFYEGEHATLVTNNSVTLIRAKFGKSPLVDSLTVPNKALPCDLLNSPLITCAFR